MTGVAVPARPGAQTLRMTRLLIASLLLAAGPAFAAAPAPTAAEVRAFMTRLENVSRSRDVAQIAAALAPDCRIELRSTVEGKEHVTLLTRDEYIDVLSSGYAALKDLENYDYTVSAVEVTLEHQPEGATVVSQVRESFVFAGRHIVTQSREVSRVERRGAELKLVAVSAETEGR